MLSHRRPISFARTRIAIVAITLLAGASSFAQDGEFVSGTLTNGLTNPDVDTYRVRCTRKTEICADASTDAAFPVVVHVSTTDAVPARGIVTSWFTAPRPATDPAIGCKLPDELDGASGDSHADASATDNAVIST